MACTGVYCKIKCKLDVFSGCSRLPRTPRAQSFAAHIWPRFRARNTVSTVAGNLPWTAQIISWRQVKVYNTIIIINITFVVSISSPSATVFRLTAIRLVRFSSRLFLVDSFPVRRPRWCLRIVFDTRSVHITVLKNNYYLRIRKHVLHAQIGGRDHYRGLPADTTGTAAVRLRTENRSFPAVREEADAGFE